MKTRMEKNIAQPVLARGLIQVADLSRFENEQRDISFFLQEALIQRLGKSCDKLELHISTGDYNLLFMRQLIIHTLLSGGDVFYRLCAAYKEEVGPEQPLHEQFLIMIQACEEYNRTKDAERLAGKLEKSIEITFAEWKKSCTESVLLCTQEIQILLLLSFAYLDGNDSRQAKQLLDRIGLTIQEQVTDEEERARIYPLYCYLMADYCIRLGQNRKVLRYIDEGKTCIADNGILSLAVEFLELEILYRKNPETALLQRDALLLFFKNTNQPVHHSIIEEFVRLNQHREIVLVHEMIRETRRSQHISQEELSWEICATETLSRIESGKRSPHRRKRELLYKKLQIDSVSYTLLVTDDFSYLEKDRELRKKLTRGDYDASGTLLDSMENGIDMTQPINRQYIGRNRITIQLEKGTISTADAVDNLKKLLHLTLPECDGRIFRTPTRNEFQIILQMATCYRLQNDYVTAEELYLSLYNQYQQSAVMEDHHARENLLLYIHLTALFSQMRQYARAKEYAQKGLALAIRCQRGDVLGSIGTNLALVYYHTGKETQQEYEGCINASIQVLDLYKRTAKSKKLYDFFQTHPYCEERDIS